MRLGWMEGARVVRVTTLNISSREQGLSPMASSLGPVVLCCSGINGSFSPIARGDTAWRWRRVLPSLRLGCVACMDFADCLPCLALYAMKLKATSKTAQGSRVQGAVSKAGGGELVSCNAAARRLKRRNFQL